MKLSRVVAIGAMAVALSACGEKATETEAAAPAAEAPGQVAPPAVAEAAKLTTQVAGVALDFPHVVRGNKVDVVDGVKRSNVRIEYQDVEQDAVAAALQGSFSKGGFKVKGGGDQKYVAYAPDGRKIRYVISPVGPDLQLKLSSPNSKGMVTFIWEEPAVAAQ